MSEPTPKRKARVHPARDRSFKQTFVLEGPTIWLLRTALMNANPCGMSKADRTRIDELSDFFEDAIHVRRFSHAFDHAKKRACP